MIAHSIPGVRDTGAARVGGPTRDATTAALPGLVCADPVLLRSEFDSIIAANYPSG